MPPFDDFAQRFDRLILRVEEVDVRVPEDSALIGLAADLVPKVTRMLRDGIALTHDAELAYDPKSTEVPKPDDGDTLTHIGLMISAELAVRDLNDVAYFARSELRGALDRLESAATRSGAELMLASSCEAGLRCLRKALVSVESAIYEFEGHDTPKRQWYDVELSLQIRKLYWNLRRETGFVGDGDDYETRLRRVLYRVVAFRELSVYPFLRVDDRVQLRDLLKRILDWLNGDSRNPDEARRVWTDLQSFAELLVQVSHRQELQTHDRDLLIRVRGMISRQNAPDALPDSILDEMQRLLGLDDELDDLIANRIGYAEAWREPLGRLLERLDKPPEPPGRIDLLSDLD